MSGVDVLAVMDADARGVALLSDELYDAGKNKLAETWSDHLTSHDEARAAVAELIEAAQALPTVRGAQVITFEGADYVLLAPEDHETLCSALARVTGAQA